jgi:hypothetical protein
MLPPSVHGPFTAAAIAKGYISCGGAIRRGNFWVDPLYEHLFSYSNYLYTMPHKDLPIRPLVRAFDPVGPDTLGPPDLDFASLFREKNVPEDAPLTLYPEQLGVPWHTSLPWVRQSKWWVQGEVAGRDLVTRISLDKASERGTLPMEFMDERRKGKIDELVEDAVSCAVYLYPSSSPTRIELLTQALLLLFFHDGISPSFLDVNVADMDI